MLEALSRVQHFVEIEGKCDVRIPLRGRSKVSESAVLIPLFYFFISDQWRATGNRIRPMHLRTTLLPWFPLSSQAGNNVFRPRAQRSARRDAASGQGQAVATWSAQLLAAGRVGYEGTAIKASSRPTTGSALRFSFVLVHSHCE